MVAHPLHIEEDSDYVFDVNGVNVYITGSINEVMKKISRYIVGASVEFIGKGKWDNDEEFVRDSS